MPWGRLSPARLELEDGGPGLRQAGARFHEHRRVEEVIAGRLDGDRGQIQEGLVLGSFRPPSIPINEPAMGMALKVEAQSIGEGPSLWWRDVRSGQGRRGDGPRRPPRRPIQEGPEEAGRQSGEGPPWVGSDPSP